MTVEETYETSLEIPVNGIVVFAQVRCVVLTSKTHSAPPARPSERTDPDEYEVTLHDIHLSECHARSDGNLIPWRSEFVEIILSDLVTELGAAACDEPETIEETTDAE